MDDTDFQLMLSFTVLLCKMIILPILPINDSIRILHLEAQMRI